MIKKPNVRACCSCWMFGGRICFVMDDDNSWLFPIAVREKQPLRQLEGMDFKYHQMPSMRNPPLWHNFCDENIRIQYTYGRRKIPVHSRVLHYSLALTISWLFAGFRDPICFTFAGKKCWRLFSLPFPVIEDVVSAAVVANLSHVRSSFRMRVTKINNFKGPWDQGIACRQHFEFCLCIFYLKNTWFHHVSSLNNFVLNIFLFSKTLNAKRRFREVTKIK